MKAALFAPPSQEHARISEQRVDELLSIAADVFFEHGYALASVGEMARRAKTSKSTYYRRYPTKENLFLAVVRRVAYSFAEHFRPLMAVEKPEDALRSFGKGLMELLLEPRSIAMHRIIHMEARNFPEMGKGFYCEGFGAILSILVDFLTEQVGVGTLQIENIPMAAEQFIDGLIGEPIRRIVLGISCSIAPIEQEQRVECAVGTFLAAHARGGMSPGMPASISRALD